MRFGAFPSSDVFQSDGGSSVQQVSSWMKPSLSDALPDPSFDGVQIEMMQSASGPAFVTLQKGGRRPPT
jgi:hypothetical protein